MSYDIHPQRDQQVAAFAGIVRFVDARELSCVGLETTTGLRSMLVRFDETAAGRLLIAGAVARWVRERIPVFVTIDDGIVRFNDDSTAITADLIAEI